MIETLTTRKSVQLSPVYASLYGEASLGWYFQKLVNEKQSGFDGKILWYREQAIKSFVKADFATFPYRKPDGLKKILDAEVELWQAILNLARHLKGYGFWQESPELTLCEIIQESALVLLPLFFSGDNEGKQSVDDCICFYQKQNIMMQDTLAVCENPFDKAKVPMTFNFVELALDMARDNTFRKKWYLPVVRARKKLTSEMKQGKICSFTEQGQLKRGKKK
jgi:hypothetical protein